MEKKFDEGLKFDVSEKDDLKNEMNEFGYEYVKGEKKVVFESDDKKKKYVMKDEL